MRLFGKSNTDGFYIAKVNHLLCLNNRDERRFMYG